MCSLVSQSDGSVAARAALRVCIIDDSVITVTVDLLSPYELAVPGHGTLNAVDTLAHNTSRSVPERFCLIVMVLIADWQTLVSIVSRNYSTGTYSTGTWFTKLHAVLPPSSPSYS